MGQRVISYPTPPGPSRIEGGSFLQDGAADTRGEWSEMPREAQARREQDREGCEAAGGRDAVRPERLSSLSSRPPRSPDKEALCTPHSRMPRALLSPPSRPSPLPPPLPACPIRSGCYSPQGVSDERF